MDYKIALANLVNGALLGYKDNSKVMEYKNIVEDKIKKLEEKEEYTKGIITVLESEIDNLKQIEQAHQQENGRLREENMELNEIIEKAKEYIEKNKHLNWYTESVYTNDLLDILNGDDNE